jgi:hypothetical protein
VTDDRIMAVLGEAKLLAAEYYRLTGKPLGVTGEVAEYEAARILGIELTPARQAGYDGVETREGVVRRVQIKGRVVQPGSKRSQRVGRIDVLKDWDSVVLVLMDNTFSATVIYEAERAAVIDALVAPGSRARNELGALAVSKFVAIGTERWRRVAPGT